MWLQLGSAIIVHANGYTAYGFDKNGIYQTKSFALDDFDACIKFILDVIV